MKVIGIWLFEKAGLRCFGGEAMDMAVWLVKERSRGGYLIQPGTYRSSLEEKVFACITCCLY